MYEKKFFAITVAFNAASYMMLIRNVMNIRDTQIEVYEWKFHCDNAIEGALLGKM